MVKDKYSLSQPRCLPEFDLARPDVVQPRLTEGLHRDPRRRLLDVYAHVLHRGEHWRQHAVYKKAFTGLASRSENNFC